MTFPSFSVVEEKAFFEKAGSRLNAHYHAGYLAAQDKDSTCPYVRSDYATAWYYGNRRGAEHIEECCYPDESINNWAVKSNWKAELIDHILNGA